MAETKEVFFQQGDSGVVSCVFFLGVREPPGSFEKELLKDLHRNQ